MDFTPSWLAKATHHGPQRSGGTLWVDLAALRQVKSTHHGKAVPQTTRACRVRSGPATTKAVPGGTAFARLFGLD
ncbi:hypothetical protein [Euzebya tangerina]|uniref:hypothetical protein n=1 Tax=Euzebya tangerina TaxID=591198 RepID=UPI000E31EA5F|nr:hypothetical protein [Euzebya tangerina]